MPSVKALRAYRRRHRRQRKARLHHGVKAKPKHKLKTGRTGSVEAKRTKSKKRLGLTVRLTLHFPNIYRLGGTLR